MRRKINIILIMTILAVLYLCQGVYTRVFGGVMALAADGEEDREENKIKGYLITYDEPDGSNGYYRKAPTICLNHQDEGLVTRYRLTDPLGRAVDGELNTENSSVCLSPEQADGEYSMEIWMETAPKEEVPDPDEEDKEEEKGEEKEEEGESGEGEDSQPQYSEEELKKWNKIFTWKVDATPPVIEVLSPEGGGWYNSPVNVRAKARDVVSGVEKTGGKSKSVSCESEGGEELHFTVGDASVNNQPVEIWLWAQDRAGNTSKVSTSVFIDMSPPVLSITGADDYEISPCDLTMTLNVREENACQNVKALVEWESPQGEKQKKILTDGAWNANSVVVEEVTQEGIYKFIFTASDKAGNTSQISKQIMVDKTCPVITGISDFQGKWLKEFCMDHKASQYVEDFTTYSCQMMLDGRLYIPGQRILREGRHILKLTAVDAAGNESTESAMFMIDHTPPILLWREKNTGKEITEESNFEKQVDILVSTENNDDKITSVKINGKSQAVIAGSSKYQCTLEEAMMYEVEVRAQDRAGNSTKKALDIQVTEEKGVLEKAVEPVREIFAGRKAEIDETRGNMEETEKKYGMWEYVVAALAGGFAIAGVLWRIRKREETRR